MSIRDIPLPKEHGAWAVLLVPMIVVASVKQVVSGELLLLALSTVAVFMASGLLQTVLRHIFLVAQEDQKVQNAKFWTAVFFFNAIFLVIPLLLQGFWWLLGFGALSLLAFVATFLLTRGSQKTISSDLVATLGLSLTGLSSYYLLEGTLNVEGFQIWSFTLLFFGSTVFYVHMKIQAAKAKENVFGMKERFSLGWLNLAYHVVTVAAVLLLASFHYTTELALVAFVPMIIHSVYGTIRLSNRVRFKNLGFILLGQSVFFAVIFTLVMSIS
ncbi:MAG: YwiC-like family protein [Ignavibacteriales bacterium]|nr:YwiC-like family protein [Ignavibacteriales bacterium]